jgi:hypothetical protein
MPGLTVNAKDDLMSDHMEEFITDTIIIAKVKNSGEMLRMADAITKKLDEHFGGSWTVFISKKWDCGWAGIPWNGTYINVDHGAHRYAIFRR